MKNLAWPERILRFANILWNYKSLVEKPFFGMLEDFQQLLDQEGFDVAFNSAIAMGCNLLLAKSGLPWISLMSIPAYPEFIIEDTDLLCNYPNMANPRSLRELKASLAVRVRNRIECK